MATDNQEMQMRALSDEACALRAQLELARGHADDGDPSAQAEVVNILARLDEIAVEQEEWTNYLADMDHMARHDPDWFYDGC